MPYGVGYVQLDDPDHRGDVIVEARLTVNDPARLVIGMEMELVVIPFAVDAEGRDVVTYAFAPVAGTTAVTTAVTTAGTTDQTGDHS